MIKYVYRMIKRFYKKMLRLNYVFYIGNKYSCPVCGGKFSHLKPFRGSYFIKGKEVDHHTPNCYCPKCFSGIRHRLVMGFLKENNTLLLGKKRILHFAPEESIINFFHNMKEIVYTIADIDPRKYKNAVKLDISNIELKDKSIDVIVCVHVLEHIQEDIKAIQELYRILNDGGWLLLAVPIYGPKTFELPNITADERRLQYGIDDHMRLNGLDLKEKLENSGFTVQIKTTHDLQGNYFDLSLSTPHSESDKYLFFCTK